MFFVNLLRHLTHGALLLSSYVAFLAVIPILAYVFQFRTQILPRLSYHLGLSLVPLDPHLLSVALVTFFVYFFFYFVMDTLYALQSLYAASTGKTIFTSTEISTTSTTTTTTRTTTTTLNSSIPSSFSSHYANPGVDPQSPGVMTPWNISVALSRAHYQVVQYYPAFVLSTLLAWANTSQFDIYSTIFVIIQAILLFLLPITYGCPGSLICHLNRVAYQCALLWTVVYAICPREIGYVMHRLADDTFGPHSNSYRRIL